MKKEILYVFKNRKTEGFRKIQNETFTQASENTLSEGPGTFRKKCQTTENDTTMTKIMKNIEHGRI